MPRHRAARWIVTTIDGRARRFSLLPRRFRLWRHRLRVEADIEDVGFAGCAWRHRIGEILAHHAEWHAGVLRHRYRGPVDFGRYHPFMDAGLHHGDTKRDFDGRGRSRRAGDHAALNADPGDDLAAGSRTIARGPCDGRLIA